MRPGRAVPRRPVLAAFVVWFVHFMLCWTAVELWPGDVRANAAAWGFTAVALLAVGVQAARLQRPDPADASAAAAGRISRGATLLAAVAIVFTAVPSLVFRA